MKKYPQKLFWLGVFMNLIKQFFLTVSGIVLLIVGIWNKPCLYIGVFVLLIDIIIAIVTQIQYKKEMETPSDNPDFQAMQDAVLSDNWRNHIIQMVEEKITENEPDYDTNDLE